MAKPTLKITTPHGEFTRTTNTAYTHAVVRTSKRALEVHQAAQNTAEGARLARNGVYQRWNKDRGFAVTWHGSLQAAKGAASKPYVWDNKTGPAEIYLVEA